jgi:SAM-dependent methyltransferase
MWIPEAFQKACLEVAARNAFPTSVETIALRVRALSEAYNAYGFGDVADHGAARLLFFFQRDVPKVGLAVQELLKTGLLGGKKKLRVLDYGAGLGASTFGLARALEMHGWEGEIEALLVEPDKAARTLADALASRIQMRGLRIKTQADLPPAGRDFDLVLLGQVLSELDQHAEDRVERHAKLLTGFLESRLRADGTLVVVEPALRSRTRHLQTIGRVLRAQVFAPCTHQGECPLLVKERDWCHEDRDVDLPSWLVPIAQAAGLRWQGVTFSYLLLRSDRKSIADFVQAQPEAMKTQRLVSDIRRTKGKVEVLLCPAGSVMRIDRHESKGNQALTELVRGSLLATDLENGRVKQATHVLKVALVSPALES